MTISKPALWVYTFAPGQVESPEVSAYLRALWDACTHAHQPHGPYGEGGLGMTASVDSICKQREFPERRDLELFGFHPLAAASAPTPTDQALHVAFLFEYHDVLGQIAFLSPNNVSETLVGWKRIYDGWRRATASTNACTLPAAVLNEAYVFYALYSGEADPAELGAAVREALPSIDRDTWDPTPACSTENGVHIWDAPDLDGRRVLVVLAPESQDAAVTAWAFWTDGKDLAPLARCLLHAAKISYEWRIYHHEMPAARGHKDRVDRTVDEILCLHRKIEAGQEVPMEVLVEAQSRLSGAQLDATGLLISLTLLKELRQTIEIAERNLQALLPEFSPGQGEHSRLFRREFVHAAWLKGQIQVDTSYLEASRERAREVYAMTILRMEQARTETTKRLEAAVKATAAQQEKTLRETERRRHEMDLLQTIVLGALLVCLDAMHAFHTALPLPEKLHWPLIITLMALVLALPMLILHWHEPYGGWDYLSGGLLGGCLAWFLLSLWWERAHAQSPPVSYVIGSLLLGTLLFVGLVKALDHSQERYRHWRSKQKPI